MAQGLNLSWDAQQSPTTTESKSGTKKMRTMGSRRIFPPRFKLQVLHSYRNDPDCKGNQRATARKYNIHRRQIQKWLQCESILRSAVEDVQGNSNGCQKCETDATERRGPRMFKHDARTLKLVAQKLYPSSSAVTAGPSECQLNDTSSDANATAEASDRCLIIKNDVMPERDVQKYTTLPSSLSPPPPLLSMPTHHGIFYPPAPVQQQQVISPLQLTCDESQISPPSSFSSSSPSSSSIYSDSSDEPCNLVKQPSKSFSPKRKWIQDSMTDNLSALPPKQRIKHMEHIQQPIKKPCPDFSIERLCGSPKPKPPAIEYQPFTPPILFPPPLVLPHRTIPDLMPLHFKPELPPPSPTCSSTDEDEPIDVTSTTPVEKKSFEFPPSKRRSFSVQFKLSVLDAFHNDKECNQNQRATARKFNINRRQVQKWLSLESDLRQSNGGCTDCDQCPPCLKVSCMQQPEFYQSSWTPHPSALPLVPNLQYMSWYNYTFNNAKIY